MSEQQPRYLGVDESGDRVWELADGRWTWGDTAQAALQRVRTFEPARYVEKYGAPQLDPAQVVAEHIRGCLGARAAIVVDGSADSLIEELVTAGWRLEAGQEVIAGKRIRTLVPPPEVAAILERVKEDL